MTADRHSLDAIAAFTATISRIETDLTLSASAKGMLISRNLAAALADLDQLELEGPLLALNGSGEPGTYRWVHPRVYRQLLEQRLTALAEVALAAVGTLHAEVGSALTSLAQEHSRPAPLPRRTRPSAAADNRLVTPRERLVHWWDTKVRPWWDDDRW